MYSYVDGDPVSFTDLLGLQGEITPTPPNFFTLTTFEALKKGVTLDEAVRSGVLTREVTLPGISIGLAAPVVAAVGVVGGAAVCRVIPEMLPKVAEACKNPLLALTLGAAICGNVSGTVKDSARNFIRDRETIEEIGNATSRTLRRNTGSASRP